VLAALVKQALEAADDGERAAGHPQSRVAEAPDPERLANDLTQLGSELAAVEGDSAEQSVLRDKLALLSTRCQWVTDARQRTELEQMANELWTRIGASA
jgi:MoxR-like ATPase